MQAYTSPRRTTGFFGDKRLISLCLGVVVIAAIIFTGFFYNRNEISINADGKNTTVIMRGGKVADALKKAQIKVGPKDVVHPPMETPLTEDTKINITRMIPFTLLADNKETQYWVAPSNVGQALKKFNIALNPGDEVIPGLNKQISYNDKIEIIRYSTQIINQSVDVPFKVERRTDNTIDRGSKKTVQEGQNGLKQRTIKITLKNGKEVKREIIGEKTIRESVNKIVAIGNRREKVVSRGRSFSYSRSLKMNATAYTHTGNRTASGVYPSRGTVAVDPRVIPLGSRLYIEGYGYATAQDVGSAIKGNRIDLFFESKEQALRWGRRSAKVYILN